MNQVEILDESELPGWVVEDLNKERLLFPNSTHPQTLGSPGYKIYHIKDNWYGWDNGTGGCLVSDGRTACDKNGSYTSWINIDDLFPNIPHPSYTGDDIVEIRKLLKLE